MCRRRSASWAICDNGRTHDPGPDTRGRRRTLRTTIAMILLPVLLAGVAVPAAAQSLVSTRNVEISFQNQMLRGAVLRDAYKPSDFLRDYRLSGVSGVPTGSHLAAYSAAWYGYRFEELSRADLALEGMGTGASLGLFFGAVGNTLGFWDEDKAWMMMGAMSAIGAVWGASRVDDPAWRIRLRWDDLDDMSVPTE